MACKDDCWEGDYEEAKEQNGCRSSSLTIATKPMMPSETDELHEPLFQTIGTFSKALFYWRDFAKKRKYIFKIRIWKCFWSFSIARNEGEKKSKNRQIFSFIFSMY